MEIIYGALYRKAKNGALVVMDAPVDHDTPNALWEAERAMHVAPEFAAYGGTAWLWPPLTMSQSGSASNADGYGRQFDLNVGQWHDRPLRWGSAQQILAANQVLHQCGLKVLEDAVIHQYDGAQADGSYPEIGADGRLGSGPFPKPKSTLVRFDRNGKVLPGYAHPDPVFDPQGNAAFGDMTAFVNGKPKGYLLDGTIRAMKWRKRRFALDGGRLDDTKGENVTVSRRIIDGVGGFWFGECFVGDIAELYSWIQRTGGKNTLDFPFHWIWQGVCDYGASLRSIPWRSVADVHPGFAIKFAESADTDNNNGENIRFNKLWPYFHGLTTPGVGMLIYAGDYERYGLARDIRQFMWVSQALAVGKLSYPYVDDTLMIWSRDGDGGQFGWSGGLVCGINTDPVTPRAAWVPTPFGPGRKLQCYLGHGHETWTNGDGWAYIEVPQNVNGTATSTVAYAPAGIDYKLPIRAREHRPVGSFTDFSDFHADTNRSLDSGRTHPSPANTGGHHGKAHGDSLSAAAARTPRPDHAALAHTRPR